MLVQSYLTRARDFFKGVTLVQEDTEYKYSSALLAIHSAISYADALRCGLGSTKLAAFDHRNASAEVRKLLEIRGYASPQGIRHLEALLSRKTFVAYSDKSMTQEEAKSMINHARRFAVWAEQAGLDLNIERWRMIFLSERQQIGRAKNTLRDYFVRKPVVPKIFFDVAWNDEQLDLLAIDRTGVGDVHALRFIRHERIDGEDTFTAEKTGTTLKIAEEVDRLHSLPTQYRYVVVIDSTGTLFLEPSASLQKKTYPEDGIGRVGLLYIDLVMDDAAIQVVIKPERFRSTAEIFALTDEYVATHVPVDEYRDPVEYQVPA